MKLNSKIIYILVILAIIIIFIILHRRNISTFNNAIYQKLSDEETIKILNEYRNFNNLEPILENEVIIKRLKDTTQLVIQNLTDTENLIDFHYQKSFGVRNNLLEYQLRDLENTNSIMSSMLVTHGQSTSPKNQKYGFILKITKDKFKPQHNLGEFCVEFTDSKLQKLNLLSKIQRIIDSPNYKNQTRKTVNLFTQFNAPADILPYFTKGTHGKEIKTVIRFLDATNIDYLRNFPNGRFNILDNNLNPILTYCKLDVPYCGVNLKPQGNIKGRDKYVSGKFNHGVGIYTIVDSDEYSKYKVDRTNRQEEEKKKTAETEIEILKTQNPTYDVLTFNQKAMIKKYDTKYYQELVTTKKEELLARPDKDFNDIDIRFISENNLQEEFDMFVGGITENLLQKTKMRYQNMDEHFTDKVDDKNNYSYLGFDGEKYLQYQKYDECMTKENRDSNTSKIVSKKYSPILDDDLMIKKDKASLDKIKEKMGFKCRKHYKESDNRYFFGGIDFDGQTKCYGDGGACKIFPKKEDCLNLEKELTQENFSNLQEGFGNLQEGFANFLQDYQKSVASAFANAGAAAAQSAKSTNEQILKEFAKLAKGFGQAAEKLAQKNKELFSQINFKTEENAIFNIKFHKDGKIHYLKKGLDVYSIGGETRRDIRFIFDVTENIDEAIDMVQQPSVNPDTKDIQPDNIYFIHDDRKYNIIFQETPNVVKYPDNTTVTHKFVLAPFADKYNRTNIYKDPEDKNYYFLNPDGQYEQEALGYFFATANGEYLDFSKYTNKELTKSVGKTDFKFDIVKNQKKTLAYREDLKNRNDYGGLNHNIKLTAASYKKNVGHASRLYDTTQSCHNYKAFRAINSQKYGIKQQIRLNKNFEISINFNYKKLFSPSGVVLLGLILPFKYHSTGNTDHIVTTHLDSENNYVSNNNKDITDNPVKEDIDEMVSERIQSM